MKSLMITITASDDTCDFDLPELAMIDGVAYCSSLQVAQHFEKRHADVLRDIERTTTQVVDIPNKRKFAFNVKDLFLKSEYEVTTGIGARVKKPMYLLTEDGFTLLAMSYEGKKAMTYKLRYMAAFKKMREHIEAHRKPPAPPKPETITQEQYNELFQAIVKTAGATFYPGGAKYQIQNYLKCQFNADPLNQMKHRHFDAAMACLSAARGQIEQTRRIFAEVEAETIKTIATGSMPSLRHLKGQLSRRLERELGKPVDAHEVLVHNYAEKNGLVLIESGVSA